MSVVVSVEDVGICRKQLKIEVPAPAVEAETERVTREYRKAARLPGFRKGKVPLGVVQKRFGEEIRKEVIDRLVPRYWHQAEAESGLEILMPPSVEKVDFEGGASLTFDAVVEVRPEIALGDIDSFELPEADTEPTEGEIDDSIEDLRRRVAEWRDAGRPAARGDLVAGQLGLEPDEDEGGEPPAPQPVSFEVGDENVWEELTLAATGKEAGGEARLERQEGPEGPLRRYRLQIEAVRERDLPPLDDEFAAKVGKFDSFEALRTGVAERLRAAKRQQSRRVRERAVLDQLRARHPLELPRGVVDKETENILRSYAEDLAQRGLDPEKADIDWQQLFEQLRPQGEKEVHGRLLLDAVVAELGVEVTEDEFETSLAALARVQGKSTPAVRQALDRAGRLGDLRTQLARDKALKRLMGEDAAAGDAESGESAESADDEEDG